MQERVLKPFHFSGVGHRVSESAGSKSHVPLRQGLAVLDFSLVPAAELLHNCLVWQVGAALKYFLPQQMQGDRRKVDAAGVNLITAMVGSQAHGRDGTMYRATAIEVQLLREANLTDCVEMDEHHNVRLTEEAFACLKTGFPVSQPRALLSLDIDAERSEAKQLSLLELACVLERRGWERCYWSRRDFFPDAYCLGGAKSGTRRKVLACQCGTSEHCLFQNNCLSWGLTPSTIAKMLVGTSATLTRMGARRSQLTYPDKKADVDIWAKLRTRRV